MVHKKYTYKNGKKFGPYYYETKRINGKIVTTYLGNKPPHKNRLDKRLLSLIGATVLAVLLLLFFIIPGFTGNVSLDMKTKYKAGEMITGNLDLNIRQGELLPADSIIRISLGDEIKEFTLSELIDEELTEGNFYAESSSISGNGQGYGLAGTKEIIPEIDFELRVFDSGQETDNSPGNSGNTPGNQDTEPNNEETPADNSDTADNPADGNQATVDDSITQDAVDSESPSEDSSISGDDSSLGNSDSEASEDEGSTPSDSSTENDNPIASDSSGSGSENEASSSDPGDSDSGPDSTAGITGAIISESSFIVSGTVTKGEDFEYNLEPNQDAEIVQGSVDIDGEELDESEIDLKVTGNKATVSTDYSIIEEGFGEDFLGEDELTITIDISDFNLTANESTDLVIELTYNNESYLEVEEDISVSKNEKVEEIFNDIENESGSSGSINATLNITNQTIINETITNQTEVNQTNITSAEVNTTQFTARLGEPVKWVKRIDVNKPAKVSVEIPSQAENVVVRKIDKTSEEVVEEVPADEIQPANEDLEEVKVDIKGSVLTGQVTADLELDESRFIALLKKIFRFTGLVVSDEEKTQEIVIDVENTEEIVEVEYYTDAPFALEEEIEGGKRVTISSPEDIHYENVLSFTELSEDLGILSPGNVRIYWEEEEIYLPIYSISDQDNNGIYDYVEWIAPHLSNQTFTIIVVVRAEHLDENRAFVSDIYDSVKELDGNWSEAIPAGHYARIRFERNLTSGNDITVYPRAVNGTPRIEIYEADEDELVAEFTSLNDNEYNKVLLDDLDSSQDAFDLLVLDGSIEFDHIVDPTDGAPDIDFVSPTPESGTQAETSIYVNVSTSDMSDHYALIDFDRDVALWMRMDDVNSSGDPLDSGTYGNNGSLVNEAVINSSGYYGNASWFDGNNDYIEILDSSSLNITGTEISIFAWVNPTACTGGGTGNFPRIVSRGDGSNSNGYQLITDSSCRPRAEIGGLPNSNYQSSVSLPLNTWSHVGVVYDNSSVRIYMNGTLILNTSATGEIVPGTGTLRIGTRDDTARDWNGGIDEVVLLSRALTDTEVLALYNASVNHYERNFTNLVNHTYDILAYSADIIGNKNSTEQRTITVNTSYVFTDVAAPEIEFVSPTPADDSTLNYDSIFVNVSSNDQSDHYSFVDFDNDLVFWMDFDELNGSGDPIDLSSYSNNGSLISASINSDGAFGNSLHTSGVSPSRVEAHIGESINMSSNFTVSFWFKNHTNPSSTYIGALDVGYNSGLVSGNDWGLRTDLSPARFRVAVRNGTSDELLNLNILDGWNQYALTFSDSNATLYRNGQIQSSEISTVRNILVDGDLLIGTRQLIGSLVNGSFDEILIFNRSLTAVEMAALYNASASKYQNNFTGLTDGAHSFTGYAKDTSSNRNSTARTVTIDTIDDTPPNITFVDPTPANGTTQISDSIYVNVSTSDDQSDHYSLVDFDRDLLLWMGFDEVNGSGDPTDLSSYSNNGSLESGAIINTTGKFGSATWLDGSSEYIDTGISLLNGLTDLTISFWIYHTGDSDEGLWGQGDGSTSSFMEDNRIFFRGSSSQSFSITDPLAVNQWQHIVIVRNTSNIYLYVDGQLNQSTSSAGSAITSATTHNFYIGRTGVGSGGTTKYFTGSMDEFAVFNRTLTSSEILALYNASANQYSHNFTGLSDGDYDTIAHAVDELGNMNSTETRTVVVQSDTFGPNISFTSPTPANGTIQQSDSILINVSSSDLSDHYTFIDFDRDLLLWMGFDEVNGSGDPTDLSSYSRNGSLQVSASIDSSGYFGNGLLGNLADGSSVYLGSTPIIGTSPNFTISLWLKTGNDGQLDFFFGEGNTTSASFNTLWTDGSNNLRYGYGSSSTVIQGPSLISDTWYHASVVKRDDNFTLYLNGLANASANDLISPPTINDVRIGGLFNGGGVLESNSSIDEVLVFNRSLTDEEILSLYDASVNQYHANISGLSSGEYDYTAYGVDKYANRNSTETRTFTIDNSPPSITINIPQNTTYQASNMNFNVTLSENGSVKYSLDGGATNFSMTGDQGSFGTEFTATHSSLGDGSYVFTVYANDTVGNVNSTNVTFSFVNLFYAWPESSIDLTAVDCAAQFGEDLSKNTTYPFSCDGEYPAKCAGDGGNDFVGCNDGFGETQAFDLESPGGIKVQYYNDNANYCRSVEEVFLCYEYWVSSAPVECLVETDSDGEESFSDVSVSCPTEVSNPGVNCVNVTSLENWSCSDFFGPTGTRASIRSSVWSEGKSGTSGDLTTDAFFFNVSYLNGTFNSPPYDPDTLIRSVGNANVTTQNVFCRVNQLLDPEADAMNLTLRWYLDGILNSTEDFNNNYANGTAFEDTLLSSQTLAGDVWSCSIRLFDGNEYSNWINSGFMTILDDYGPIINFTDPTPANGTVLGSNSIYANLSTIDETYHYSFVEMNKDLLLWMRFDDVNGSGDPVDLSSYSNNGTLENGASIIDLSGKYSDAAWFDGVDDQISLAPDQLITEENTNYTYAFWVKRNDSQGLDGLLGNGQLATDGMSLYINQSGNIVLTAYSTGGSDSIHTTYSVGTDWTFVTLLLDTSSGTDKIYVNGVLNASGNAAGNAFIDSSITLGNGYVDTTPEYLNGSLDEVLVFQRALTDTEIGALYNATQTQYSNNFTGLADGTYEFTGYASDLAANNNQTETRTVTIDTIDDSPPNINFTNPTPADDTLQTIDNIYVNISSVDQSQHYTFTDFNGDLALWMRMDDVNSTDHPIDLSSHSNNGTLENQAFINSTGKFGNASWFDGDDDAIDLPILNISGSITVSAWINSVQLSGGDKDAVGNNGGGGDSQHFSLGLGAFVNDDIITFLVDDGSTADFVQSDFSISANTWYHAVGVFDDESNEIRLYVNGKLNDTQSYSTTPDWQEREVNIGKAPIGGRDWNGSIDEVMIFDRALSATEIKSLYDAAVNQYSNNFTNLDEDAYDIIGHSVDIFSFRNSTETRTILVNSEPPNINFTNPTPMNGTIQDTDSIFVNMSSNDLTDHYSFVDFDDDLLLWMGFDEVNGSGDPTDLSSYSRNGSLVSGAEINTSGKFGSSVDVDESGTNSVYLGSTPIIGTSQEFTISLWVNLVDDGGSDFFYSEGSTSSSTNYNTLWYNGADLLYGYNGGSGGSTGILSYSGFSPGSWQYLTVTKDSANFTIYVNGTAVDNGISILNPPTINDVRIGALNNGGSIITSDSLIDEVLIFNRSLSAAEIAALYNATQIQYSHDFTGLSAGTYNFEGHAVDISANRNNTETRTIIISEDDLTSPNINFTSPTPANGTVQENNDIFVNVSSNDASDHYSFVDFDDDLMLWWRFDDLNSTGGITDLSKNSLNASRPLCGICQPGQIAQIGPSPSKFGDSASFISNQENVILMDKIINLSASQNYTFSIWIRNDDDGEVVNRSYFSFRGEPEITEDNPTLFAYSSPDGKLYFGKFVTNPGISLINTSTGVINDLTWHHLVMTLTSGTDRIYVDGAEVSSGEIGTATTFDYSFRLGSVNYYSSNSDEQFFNGFLDDFLIFNRALTETEILSLYNASVNQYSHNFTGLSDGIYDITAHAVDSSANMNSTETRTITVDNNPPNINFTSPTPVNGTTQNNPVVINVSSSDFTDHYVFTEMDRDVLFWMGFDEVNGSGDPVDLSSYSHNGSLIDNASVDSQGKFGKASKFDGSGDYIFAPGVNITNRSYSISAWVKPTAAPSDQVFFAVHTTFGDSQSLYFKIYDDGKAEWGLWNDDLETSPGLIDFNEWNHLTFVYDAPTDTSKIYHNGIFNISSNNGPFLGEDPDIHIGRWYPSNPDYFTGLVDEVIIFNRSLNSSEVLSLYDASANQYINSFTNLSLGTHEFTARAVDSAGEVNSTETRIVNVQDLKTIGIERLYPLSNLDIIQNEFFNVTLNVSCLVGNCGGINVSFLNYIGPHVYIGGVTSSGNTTRKYDSDGNLLWSLNNGDDVNAIAVDIDGNVYTAAFDSAPDGNTTRKYDSDGNLLWSVDHEEDVNAIAVDADGNVYTGGDATFSQSPTSKTTRKYNSTGGLVWSIGDGNSGNVNAIAVDADGNVYTGGDNDGITGMSTVKRNSSSIFLWNADHGATVNAIAVDADGNVYTGGNIAPDGNTTRKYDSDGNLLWSLNNGDDVNAIAVDSSGNIYTAGNDSAPDGNTTRKYNSDGNLLWSVDHGDSVDSIAVDSEGNVYTGGDDGTGGFTTRKYNSDGNLLWSVDHGDSVNAIAIDPGIYDAFPDEWRGLISDTSGEIPLWTNDSNPRTIDLNEGESQIITAWINATGNIGLINILHEEAALNSDPAVNNATDSWNVTIISPNSAPFDPVPSINSTDGSNKTAQDLNGFAVISDPDGDAMNVSVRWYNNSVLHLQQDYNNSYSNGTLFNAILDDGNTTKGQNWTFSMRLFDGEEYSNWTNSSSLTILNTPPTVPTLLSPEDGNSTTDRTPQFSWSASIDDDQDTLSYELNTTLVPGDLSTCVDPSRHITEISGTSHELTEELRCLYDYGDYYNWSIRAHDGEEYSTWADPFRINITAQLVLTLVNDSVNFGQISFNTTDNTVDNSPLPLLIQNDGNVLTNVSINASDLWNSVSNPSQYYQYKIDNYTLELGSFNWGSSKTIFTNMPNIPELAIAELNYTNSSDTAEIDINITVPPNEGSGVRSSMIIFTANLGE